MNEELPKQAEELIVLLRRFRLGLYGWANRQLAKGGINLSQYTVLSLLDEMGETSMGPLAEQLGTTMGAATNLVDKLVYAGFVKRGRDEEDRRVVKVRLTPEGRDLFRRSTAEGVEVLAGLLAELSPEERRAFMDVKRKLVVLVRERTARDGTRSTEDRS